ncbi:MAG: VWA domain-containing protein [Acidimicrobiales bacterium]|nr:VWA domain-containing protein [Acidimicrobiales bacterium]
MTTASTWTRRAAFLAASALIITGCGGGGSNEDPNASDDPFGDPGNCTVIETAVSSEKIDLMTDLAKQFNTSDEAKSDGGCVFVRPYSKASGGATTALAEGWDESADGAKPVIWSPAASSWGQILNQRLANDGQGEMVSAKPVSFMLTPLVIAMPKPMADALNYPETPIGWADIAELSTSQEGWAKYGHPEWGAFKLGKTNPNFSTSGLSALISQTYAATGKTRDLSTEDLNSAKVKDLAKQIESSVVHYGDITMTFLNNWYRTDRSGTSLLYASAVAVEEKSVVDYNSGNPDGVLEPGETPRKPKVPLVSIYPKEGTLYSDSPLYVLDAEWVSEAQRDGAQAFIEFVQRPEAQRKVLDYGFRPANPDVAVTRPIVKENGVDPSQPAKLLQVPSPPVMIDLLDSWRNNRKGARVLLVLDVSGSMEEPADPEDPNGETKLDLAKRAAIEALGEFNSTDQVGLRVFTTNLGPNEDLNYLDVLPVQPMSTNREKLRNQIRNQIPQYGTPLYDVTQSSFEEMTNSYDKTLINAVVLLTDGVNDDGDTSDDRQQFQSLITSLQNSTSGENSKPVRVFTIAYGKSADFDTLEDIAQASNAAAYDASDPASINKVFVAVLSNF